MEIIVTVLVADILDNSTIIILQECSKTISQVEVKEEVGLDHHRTTKVIVHYYERIDQDHMLTCSALKDIHLDFQEYSFQMIMGFYCQQILKRRVVRGLLRNLNSRIGGNVLNLLDVKYP